MEINTVHENQFLKGKDFTSLSLIKRRVLVDYTSMIIMSLPLC